MCFKGGPIMKNHAQIAQARRDFLNGIKFTLSGFYFRFKCGQSNIVYYNSQRGKIFVGNEPICPVLHVKDEWADLKAGHSMGFNRIHFANIEFLPGISKKDFMAGCSFMYSGHFQTLTRYSLHYDAKDDQLKDDTAGFEFDIVTMQPEGFKFYASGTVITINFNECELREVTNG
jgi:hypothetical protein